LTTVGRAVDSTVACPAVKSAAGLLTVSIGREGIGSTGAAFSIVTGAGIGAGAARGASVASTDRDSACPVEPSQAYAAAPMMISIAAGPTTPVGNARAEGLATRVGASCESPRGRDVRSASAFTLASRKP
jgi:hypothetical protein